MKLPKSTYIENFQTSPGLSGVIKKGNSRAQVTRLTANNTQDVPSNTIEKQSSENLPRIKKNKN